MLYNIIQKINDLLNNRHNRFSFLMYIMVSKYQNNIFCFSPVYKDCDGDCPCSDSGSSSGGSEFLCINFPSPSIPNSQFSTSEKFMYNFLLMYDTASNVLYRLHFFFNEIILQYFVWNYLDYRSRTKYPNAHFACLHMIRIAWNLREFSLNLNFESFVKYMENFLLNN